MFTRTAPIPAFVLLAALSSHAAERTQTFDKDPGWDGLNNRSAVPEPEEVRQDFGFSETNRAGGERDGEIGGFISPSAEPAYYAKEIPTATFDDTLSASGKLFAEGNQFHLLVGFFNAGTVNEWRTPNSIALRLYGRGDRFYAYVEYTTAKWRAGGDSPGGFDLVPDPEAPGRMTFKGFPRGKTLDWSIAYDPAAHEGRGSVTVTLAGQTAICHLDDGHKQDGASFNRFGMLNIVKSHDDGGEVWLDDVAINGVKESFDSDPTWTALGNRRTYTSGEIRPRFDFGFSQTHHAGGKSPGELGGIIFRGDNRSAEKLAYYGDRVEGLTPAKPLRASGKVALRRGVSDSTALIGFFNSKDSVTVAESSSSGFPMNFLGAAVEGPSREGFQFYPVYRFPGGADNFSREAGLPHILPDGNVHDWSLEYDPAVNGTGRITVTFDGQPVNLNLGEGHKNAPAEFDRFGIVTTWVDGNSQHLYFDDLTYTFRQE